MRLGIVILVLAVATLAGCGRAASSAPPGTVSVVAAENEYGSMAAAIGGKDVHVVSLLSNPNTDPHEFESSASTAEVVAKAQLVIKNGIGYDSWLDKLLSASPNSHRVVFSVGDYLGKTAGDNPHVWYDPSGWSREAAVITADLVKLAPQDKTYFEQRKAAWLHQLQPIYRVIAHVRSTTRGARVIATEPVYGYMLAALGLTSIDDSFQKAVMDGTDPSPQSVSEFETALRTHSVRMLFYNSQVIDPTTTQMRTIARQSGVPIVGVTETQPQTLSFPAWQISQLRAVQREWK